MSFEHFDTGTHGPHKRIAAKGTGPAGTCPQAVTDIDAEASMKTEET